MKKMKYLELFEYFGNYGGIDDTIRDKKDLEHNVEIIISEIRKAMEETTDSINNLHDVLGTLERIYGGSEDNLKLNWIGDKAESEYSLIEELEYFEEDLREAANKVYQTIHDLKNDHDNRLTIKKHK